MDAKVWWQSKTFWLNLVAIIVAVGYYLLDQPNVIPAQYAVYFAAFLGALNIVLRFVSDQPITLTRKKTDDANG